MSEKESKQQPPPEQVKEVTEEMLNQVEWENPQEEYKLKGVTSKFKRLIEYKVEGIGMVGEEWQLETAKDENGKMQEEVAFHSVYVNGKLVRKIDRKGDKVIVNEEKYEPYDFLRYGPACTNDNESNPSATDKVPALGAPPPQDNKAKAKEDGGSSGGSDASPAPPSQDGEKK